MPSSPLYRSPGAPCLIPKKKFFEGFLTELPLLHFLTVKPQNAAALFVKSDGNIPIPSVPLLMHFDPIIHDPDDYSSPRSTVGTPHKDYGSGGVHSRTESINFAQLSSGICGFYISSNPIAELIEHRSNGTRGALIDPVKFFRYGNHDFLRGGFKG